MILVKLKQNAKQNAEFLEEIEDCSTITTTALITIGTMAGITITLAMDGTTITTDGTMVIDTIVFVGFGKPLFTKK